jgi:V/A-type H+-transporting ATPase subunit I
VPFNRQDVIDEVLSIKSDVERLEAEREQLGKSIEDLSAWGDFSLTKLDPASAEQFWFYSIPLHELGELSTDSTWYIAHRDNRFAYVIVIAEQQPGDVRFAPIQLDHRPLSELRTRLSVVEGQIDELHWRRVSLTRWTQRLKRDLDAADDASARAAAANAAVDDESVFAVKGYIPSTAIDGVRAFAERYGLALTLEPIPPEETAPTLLSNPEPVAGAEECVTFYLIPGYHAWDPTAVVFYSFSLFFAMIVGDAGYGALFAIGLGIAWYRWRQSETFQRVRYLLLAIVIATIAYGVVLGSYFGIEPPSGSHLDGLRIRIEGKPMMEHQTGMMIISVAIGVTHLVLANLISAWRSRGSSRWIGHLGWALAMIAGLLAASGTVLDVDTMTLSGKWMIAFALIAILLFSSDRPWMRSPRDACGRILDGLLQFTNISKAFGDVLSYLRLFALGLASMQLAATFNGLAAGFLKSGGMGILLAVLVFVVGHTINLLLGILGGVVHGLRLNCIEFFNWSLTDEGYAFQPFRRKAED